MAVSLQKGQKVDLTKGNASLKSLIVGLGWDGSNGGDTIDCDASAIMLGENGKISSSKSIVLYYSMRHVQCSKYAKVSCRNYSLRAKIIDK